MRLQSRIYWLLVLVAHALGAAAWWWLMPHGFGVAHPRHWVNGVWPWVLVGTVLAALWAGRQGHWRAVRLIVFALAAIWGGAGLGLLLLFPHSRPVVLVAPWGLAAAVGVAGWAEALRRQAPGPWRWASVSCTVVGVLLIAAEWSPAPDTRPWNGGIPSLPTTALPPDHRSAELSADVRVYPSSGSLQLMQDRHVIELHPMLTFISRSRDAGWTNWARAADRLGPGRRLLGTARGDRRLTAWYADDDISLLDVQLDGDDNVQIESLSRLPAAVYSHLNTFCEIDIAGHRKLSIEFSPCPGQRIGVTCADYPIGRAARFAYLGPGGIFRVVEASSGEKGPFMSLAQGKLWRDDRLTLTLYDGDEPFGRIAFDDWAIQAGAQLSPTAGWGVSVNAIEFSLNGDNDASPASIFMTLAATSVGRGWDSVGHAPGRYRNRMRVALAPLNQ